MGQIDVGKRCNIINLNLRKKGFLCSNVGWLSTFLGSVELVCPFSLKVLLVSPWGNKFTPRLVGLFSRESRNREVFLVSEFF